MGFIQAVTSVFGNYANFRSRASRSEYWYYSLFLLLAYATAAIIDFGVLQFRNTGPAMIILALATFLPSLAVLIRRLHDAGKSGWYILLQLIPLVGPLIILYWLVSPGTAGPNAFGPASV